MMEAARIEKGDLIELVIPEVAARRIGRKAKTIRNWACSGQIGAKEGVCHVRGRLMIDWQLFEAAMVKRG